MNTNTHAIIEAAKYPKKGCFLDFFTKELEKVNKNFSKVHKQLVSEMEKNSLKHKNAATQDLIRSETEIIQSYPESLVALIGIFSCNLQLLESSEVKFKELLEKLSEDFRDDEDRAADLVTLGYQRDSILNKFKHSTNELIEEMELHMTFLRKMRELKNFG